MSVIDGCRHVQLITHTEKDCCYWVTCITCGVRGPKKHSKPLAVARFRATRGVFRGYQGRHPVRYTGTAARDDERFARIRQ